MIDIALSRECGTCTACCEGWLKGEIRGHKMYPGKNCHFLGCNGCTIYEDRPQEPCRNFECVWLKDKSGIIPEWMKPELSKVIIKEMEYELQIMQSGFGTASWVLENAAAIKTVQKFWYVVEMGETISGPVLNWLIQYALEIEMPLIYHIDGKQEVLGPPDFHTWATESKDRPLEMTK